MITNSSHDGPIPFKDDMVRGVLDDTKTQTRRILDLSKFKVELAKTVCSDLPAFGIHPKIVAKPGIYRAHMNPHGAVSIHVDGDLLGVKPGEFNFLCKYGVGDTHLGEFGGRKQWVMSCVNSSLWVKQAYSRAGDGTFLYRHNWPKELDPPKWKPGMFMPRAASKINILVSEIRIERLQDITEEDARAEGVKWNKPFRVTDDLIDAPDGAIVDGFIRVGNIWEPRSAREMFADLWDSINGKKYPWASNPWVFAIHFVRQHQ